MVFLLVLSLNLLSAQDTELDTALSRLEAAEQRIESLMNGLEEQPIEHRDALRFRSDQRGLTGKRLKHDRLNAVINFFGAFPVYAGIMTMISSLAQRNRDLDHCPD